MIAASRLKYFVLALVLIEGLYSSRVLAAGNAPVGGGGSCSYSTEGDGTVGQQQAYDDGLYTCLSGSSTWAPEAFMVGSVLQSGSAATCSSTYAGMLQWTGSLLQYCNGLSWTNIGTAGGSGITLGTSASVTNPQRSADLTTGEFSPATGAWGISSGGTEEMRVNATGVGIGTTAPGAALHVFQSSSGATASGIFGAAIFEKNGNAGISVLSPDASQSGVALGSPSQSIGGQITWSYSGQLMAVGPQAGGALALRYGTNLDGIRITSSGNVGIGTTAPGALFDVNGAMILGNQTDTTNQGYIQSFRLEIRVPQKDIQNTFTTAAARRDKVITWAWELIDS